MTEKCYREIQSPSQLGGVSPVEAFVLLAVPIVLAPIFTVLGINLIFALAADVVLYTILRFGNRLSGFEHGIVSYVSFHFRWPRKLSGFNLREHDYLRQRRITVPPSLRRDLH